MLDLFLSVALVACALVWAWFGIVSLRRQRSQDSSIPTEPVPVRVPVRSSTSLLAAGLAAAVGLFLIDRSGADPRERGVHANEVQGAPSPSDFVYSGTTTPPWWAAYPSEEDADELDMTSEFQLDGLTGDGLNWRPVGN